MGLLMDVRSYQQGPDGRQGGSRAECRQSFMADVLYSNMFEDALCVTGFDVRNEGARLKSSWRQRAKRYARDSNPRPTHVRKMYTDRYTTSEMNSPLSNAI